MNFLQVLSFLFIFQLFQLEAMCQSNDRLSSIYSTLIEESSLSVRMDEFGQSKILVYYPNGVLREKYRVTGMLWVDEKTETIGMSFVLPIEQLDLVEDTTELEDIQFYFEPWNVSFSRNEIGGDLQMVGDLILPQNYQNQRLLEVLNANLDRLESWLTQYDLLTLIHLSLRSVKSVVHCCQVLGLKRRAYIQQVLIGFAHARTGTLKEGLNKEVFGSIVRFTRGLSWISLHLNQW